MRVAVVVVYQGVARVAVVVGSQGVAAVVGCYSVDHLAVVAAVVAESVE